MGTAARGSSAVRPAALSSWSGADPAGVTDGDDTGDVVPAAVRVANAPLRVGRYEILRPLGEGGFGTVYLAFQTHPVQRKVALKVVKLGMDSAEVLERFERERQVLAMMDHPCVAKVYDAGVTERGQPYFAMEYVDGVPLSRFVDDEVCSLHQRLELFIDVCKAVQHAHQKGLIHRDLKPGNILVTRVDGRPVPKVIDFGIAKAMSDNLVETQFRTETGRLIGTPEYMSPEQCAGSPDIDTRTDVYALGVILYELLTGQLPFDPTSLRSGGLEGITRIIREVEPPRPSLRVTAADAVSGEQAARSRRTDLRHLQRALSGDLDWIVLKAIEKDRDRRYATASDLAADVRRHLDHQPVSAGPPDLRYRLGKFARRNKLLVATTSAVAAAVVVGLLLATVGFVTASRARDRAEQALLREREARRNEQLAREAERLAAADTAAAAREAGVQLETANAVKGFLVDLFAAADPARARGRESTVRDVLDAAAERLDRGRFADRPDVEIELRSTLAATYRTLGLLGHARRQLDRALATARESPGLARTLRLSLHNRAGLLALDEGDADAAIEQLREAAILASAHFGQDSVESALARQNLGNAYRLDGALADAERLLRDALADLARGLPETDARVAVCRNNLAAVHHLRGELDIAERLFRHSLADVEARHGPDHPEVAAVCRNLALVLHDRHQLEEAEVLLARAVRVWKAVYPAEHPAYREVLELWGDCLRDLGRLEQAAVAVAEALAIRERVHGAASAEACAAMANLANLRQRQGRLDDALELADELLRRASASLRPDHPDDLIELAGYLALRGTLLLDLHRVDDAEPDVRLALELRTRHLPEGDWRTANTRSLLGALLLARGDVSAAEPVLFEAHETLRHSDQAPPVAVERSRERLRALYKATGRDELARTVK
ncbi:MAG: protein kinase domain-containing protein [Tepidisphaerales bacterium]